MMTAVMRSSRLVRSPDLIATEMDGDVVMMDVARGNYYGLGGVGSRVWTLLEEPRSIDELVATVCDEYDVDDAICAEDLLRFTGQLLANGAVKLC